MAIGYLIIAIPTPTPVPSMALYLGLTCFGFLVIAFGNGLFKGNLQALVGQMYDDPKYSNLRDAGFQIFYMFINIDGTIQVKWHHNQNCSPSATSCAHQ